MLKFVRHFNPLHRLFFFILRVAVRPSMITSYKFKLTAPLFLPLSDIFKIDTKKLCWVVTERSVSFLMSCLVTLYSWHVTFEYLIGVYEYSLEVALFTVLSFLFASILVAAYFTLEPFSLQYTSTRSFFKYEVFYSFFMALGLTSGTIITWYHPLHILLMIVSVYSIVGLCMINFKYFLEQEKVLHFLGK